MTSANEEALLRKAVLSIEKLQKKIESLESAQREPIAVIGIGCRLPGGETVERLWESLSRGEEALAEVPSGRARRAGAAAVLRRSGNIGELDGFDASFFRIGAAEASRVDARQRLLLEVSWEALERAGVAPETLAGERVGVYVGASVNGARVPSAEPSAYNVTGSLSSVIGGRVSFFLGLQGPCIVLDTACSSSLVAIHVACRALRAQECEMALAGGVSTINFGQDKEQVASWEALGVMSGRGRCSPFDAAADGFVPGEGCAMVVLKRLSAAKRDGDRVLAVIRGTAINHDGRSQALTAPNGLAQRDVIRRALEDARIAPADIDWVECHGTGTALGDPVEVQALGAVLGEGRGSDRPVLIGSIKGNIGHTDATAGVAGLIKTVLGLQHRTVPKSLHFETPNPQIPWAKLPVKVAAETTAWPLRDVPRRAGVSSFGISGTNAHVVLEEAPAFADAPDLPLHARGTQLVVLSAKSPGALDEGAARLRAHLEKHPEQSLLDIAFSLATTRTHHEHRLALSVATREELSAALEAVGRGETPAGSTRGQVVARPKVVFVFPGQGSQWLGMGRELLSSEPVFRAALEECDRAIAAEAGWSLLEELAAAPERSRLEAVDVVQPALFAMGVALAALWRSWGIEPSAVVGHSQGEIAAAYVAGALTLQDAVAVVCRRSQLLRKLAGTGGMAMVGVSVSEAEAAIAGLEDRLSVAVSNSPRSTVLSGESTALSKVLTTLEARGVFCKRVKVDYASHSLQVEPIRDALRAALGHLSPRRASVPMHSTVTGTVITGTELNADYWVNNLRQPVRFAETVQGLLSSGHGAFVEMSPHPVLLAPLEELGGETPGLVVASSLRRERAERASLLESLGALHVAGCPVDWSRLAPTGRRVDLPTYAWQRQRYPVDPSTETRGGEATGHPLLGARVSSAGADAVYESVLSRAEQPWLYDHRVADRVLVPGAALGEMVRAAAEHRFEGAPAEVLSLVLLEPLVLPENGAQRVQVVVTGEGDQSEVTVYSQPADAGADAQWTRHAGAEVRPVSAATPQRLQLTGPRGRCTESVDVKKAYQAFASVGLAYGPAFRGMRSLQRGKGEILAQVVLPEGVDGVHAYGVHPALLDAAFQAVTRLRESAGLWLPFAMDRLTVYQSGATTAIVHARLKDSDGEGAAPAVDVTLTDVDGQVLVEVFGLRGRPAEVEAIQGRAARGTSDALYRVEWPVAPSRPEATLPAGRWVVVADAGNAVAEALADKLDARRAECVLVQKENLKRALPAEHVVCVWGKSGNNNAAEAALRVASEGLEIAQLLARQAQASRLWLVTTGAVGITADADVAVEQAPLWGLGRTVRAEHPELGCTLVDTDASATADASADAAAEALLRELGQGEDEPEVAFCDGNRHVARVMLAPSRGVPAGENYALETKQKGMLDQLGLVRASRRAPSFGKVEIEIRSSGLNFRDVLNALGMYPGEAGALGGEGAGTVVAVGPGVERYAVGDAVMGLVPGSFSRFVTVDARLVAPMPAGLTFDEAAASSVVFLTAWYALHDLAGLKRGERVLIHAAAGGVGMAAVQLARWLGAEVFCTASAAKWEVVRQLGVEHLGNSRDLSFVDAFRGVTDGQGVDVVLNSLAREFVDASLSLLPRGGRFIEMGKTDIRDASAIASAHPGVTYRAFDLMEAGPDRIAEMLDSIVKGFASGQLKPLPVRAFPITEAEAAFRFMAQGAHIGKLVLGPPRRLRTDGTVLVTGGLGALGLHVARWLVDQGVKHLVLTGRRGKQTPGAREAVAELEARGAQVTVAAVDVAERAALAAVIDAIPRELPLRGVVHTAGVLDDGVLLEQSAARIARVMSPKVNGACHLDALTRALDLDVFVMFSSVSGTLGSAGQVGYAAANTFLDALAAKRRADGLPGLSLAWSLWTDTEGRAAGMASGLDRSQQERTARGGVESVSPAQGMALFEAALRRSESQLMPVPLDLRRMRKAFDAGVPHLWRGLVHVAKRAVQAQGKKGAWARELGALPEGERMAAVLQVVRAEVARVLALSGPVAVDRPLKEAGLDSLMAVELRNALGRRADTRLPATLAFDHPTPAAIAKYLVNKVLAVVETTTVAAPPTPSRAVDEPIAIVGIGCRYPGGIIDPDSFWRLIDGGVDAVSEIPPERWDVDALYDPDPDAVGKTVTRSGGFVNDIDRFDASFFGISPREAVSLEPQQRLLLETSWEALERAGILPDQLMGSRTGVFVGLMPGEYGTLRGRSLERLDGYAGTGSMPSVASGRISYVLGLQGPSLTVDTACSSSLVALHLACQALRNGECTMALAGGATLMLTPSLFVEFSRLRKLAPDGRCKSFSAAADGLGFSEGCGMLVVERLSDARQNGHRVLALIRGSAVNQHGRSNGLAAPNGPSQEAMIRQALAHAGVLPADVGYVECHGTGTTLGDPVEVQALGSVLAEGRDPAQPVVIGTVKSNLGHTQAAGGVAGIIKTVLSLSHERIPKNLHFDAPNPQIAWDELPVKVASEAVQWRRNGAPRIAGVSSFGVSGTNAHVVLSEAPVDDARVPVDAAMRAAEWVVLSAKSPGALHEAALRLLAHVQKRPDQALGDIAYSLATTRTHHEHRLALAAPTREALASALDAVCAGEMPSGVVRGEVHASAGKLAWLFTGLGAQTLGMGRGLYAEWPVFRDALDAACAALDPHLNKPLRDVMWAPPGSALAGALDDTAYAQPALFALEVALAALWRSWGVEPDLVAGHSIGELAAAHVAGVFSLGDAARLVAARGRLMQALPAGGAMVAIGASERDVAAAVAPHADSVSVAAVNGPESVVVSGAEAAVLSIAESFATRGVRTERLIVSHAFHSPQMEPMLSEFRRVAESVKYDKPRVPMVSNVSGKLAGPDVATAEYWVRHVREAVRFADGVRSLHEQGAGRFLEVGPMATLLGLVPACLPSSSSPSDGQDEALLLASLRAERAEAQSVLEALGGYYAHGGTVDYKGVFPAGGRRVELPTYAWQRQRYWVTETREGEATARLDPARARVRESGSVARD